MKNMKKELKLQCNKCNREANVDEKKSNENWIAYVQNPNDKCECGGKFEFKI